MPSRSGPFWLPALFSLPHQERHRRNSPGPKSRRSTMASIPHPRQNGGRTHDSCLIEFSRKGLLDGGPHVGTDRKVECASVVKLPAEHRTTRVPLNATRKDLSPRAAHRAGHDLRWVSLNQSCASGWIGSQGGL